MIARKTWREIRVMAFGYTLILELLLIPAILLWPTLRTEMDALARMMPIQSFRDMILAIGSEDESVGYSSYMAVQMFFKGTNIVGIAGAVLLGTALIARERENHTLEFLLARPVSRTRILLSKISVVTVALVVPIFLTSWTAIPLSWLIEENLPFAEVTLASFHASMFIVLFAALTCLCSVLANSQAHTAFMVGGVVIFQVAIYFIQEIRVASIFRVSDWEVYGPTLLGNESFYSLFFEQTLWLILGSIGLIGIALLKFRRATP